MKDRNGESVKVNDPRAARSWPRRGQRLMGRYKPAAERGWIDVGIIGAEQSRAEQSRAEQSRTEQSRAEQSRAEQNRTEQSRAEQSGTASVSSGTSSAMREQRVGAVPLVSFP
ncbi:hypothetical protein QLX08_011495 [Tetragonisca angustula]|uniref:Uncharacterized protein n=1 Tax=Tetragonisca angustula TaxID=166442 RepID=A0AAW0ZAL8_9HYME